MFEEIMLFFLLLSLRPLANRNCKCEIRRNGKISKYGKVPKYQDYEPIRTDQTNHSTDKHTKTHLLTSIKSLNLIAAINDLSQIRSSTLLWLPGINLITFHIFT